MKGVPQRAVMGCCEAGTGAVDEWTMVVGASAAVPVECPTEGLAASARLPIRVDLAEHPCVPMP